MVFCSFIQRFFTNKKKTKPKIERVDNTDLNSLLQQAIKQVEDRPGGKEVMNLDKFHGCVNEIIEGHDKRSIKDGHKWTGIVIHHTGTDGKDHNESWYKRYTQNISKYLAKKDKAFVSAHFVIGRDGKIIQIINPRTHIAWHAGKSSFWNSLTRKWTKGCNNNMIGIELVGDGNLFEYTKAQYQYCARLCGVIMDNYGEINPNCIVGHEMISPGRKVDPGRFFNWRKLFQLIYAIKARN